MFRITRDPSSGSFIQCLAKITVITITVITAITITVITVITITVILAKHCIKLPYDGFLVIRNMLEQF